MRWRIRIFFLSATAAFCFMLLTASTDYGANRSPSPLASAVGAGSARPLAAIAPAGNGESTVSPAQPAAPLAALRPKPAILFVPENADPVRSRREAEQADQASRGAPASRKRLKWDKTGWYREEVAMVTAYCPCARCCGSLSPGITSIGKNAWLPGVAADPLYLNYGTRIFVPGYGLAEIDDTGGAMRRHWRRDGLLHVDLRMTYHHEAKQWGKQYLRVKIYDD
ncbi:MAG: 3D domain-containing protein [Planctomycetota bacterium]|jgi:3D (Asp-Asp-Asp) domain-containing protein|nr:3D domain-containing protein [Planctomycetota bacterium]